MKPTAKQRAVAGLLLCFLPLLLIMLVDHKKPVDKDVVFSTQEGPAVPFQDEQKLFRAPTTTIPPTTTTVPPTTTTVAPQPITTTTQQQRNVGSVNWDAVANCESGGNWSTNTGNGYYGGLQMDSSFWSTYSTKKANGDPIAARADLASRAEQIRAADRAYATRGLKPWPVCGKFG